MWFRFSLGDTFESECRIDRKLPNSSGRHLTRFSQKWSRSRSRSYHFSPRYQVRFGLFRAENSIRWRRIRHFGIGICPAKKMITYKINGFLLCEVNNGKVEPKNKSPTIKGLIALMLDQVAWSRDPVMKSPSCKDGLFVMNEIPKKPIILCNPSSKNGQPELWKCLKYPKVCFLFLLV